MENFISELIDKVFPELKHRMFLFLKEQQRNPRNWLIFATIIALVWVILNFEGFAVFTVLHAQLVFETTLFFWIIAIVLTPFLWPTKPGDFFHDDFRKGIAPQVWEHPDGNWQVELDENGNPLLSVTDSDRGGLVIPALSWTDYELLFETRIINRCTAWIVRATDLNNYVMFQLTETLFRPHRRVNYIWPSNLIEDIPHNLPIRIGEWYSVRTTVRGAWVQVHITIANKETALYKKEILGTQPVFPVTINPGSAMSSTSLVAPYYRVGSFGFRVYDGEKAQFRNVRAYKLR